MPYIADGVSRAELRDYAGWIRKTIGFEKKPYFPIVKFMENVIPIFFPEFYYEIAEDHELEEIEGLTLPHKNKIILPETVYNEAIKGKGRARFTVSHEVAHYFLINDENIALARSSSNIPSYQDPEWQANALASEILIPPHLSVGMCAEEIMNVFGVSYSAAQIHIRTKFKEGMP